MSFDFEETGSVKSNRQEKNRILPHKRLGCLVFRVCLHGPCHGALHRTNLCQGTPASTFGSQEKHLT